MVGECYFFNKVAAFGCATLPFLDGNTTRRGVKRQKLARHRRAERQNNAPTISEADKALISPARIQRV